MANFTPVEQHERNNEFERIVTSFDIVPMKRKQVFKRVGNVATGLHQVINDYYLPNVKDGHITTSKEIDLAGSDKTALIPVFPGEKVFTFGLDSLIPTKTQLEKENLGSHGKLDELLYYLMSRGGEHKLPQDLLAGEDARAFSGALQFSESMPEWPIIPSRQILAMKSGVLSAKDPFNSSLIQLLTHESTHILQGREMSRAETERFGQVPKELEAFYVQAKLRETVHDLLGMPVDMIDSDYCAPAVMVDALLTRYFKQKSNGGTINITREKIRQINELDFNAFLDSLSHISEIVTLRQALDTRKDVEQIRG
jgi:hypothetical protein